MQDTEIKLKCINNVWYAEDTHTGYWGKASSPSEAIENIQEQKSKYAEFQKESGFKPIDSIKPQFAIQRFLKNIWPSVKILIIVSLAAIPLHLAISTGIKEGGASIKDSFDGSGVWGRIDKMILKLGDPKFELTDEKAQKLREALERIQNRYDLLDDSKALNNSAED